MAQRNDRWLDHTGLNLIRIVIGSYFLAISIGLVQGVDKTALFAAALPADKAALAGSALLMILSLAFMSGLFLRLSALMLALFVLCSGIMETYVLARGHSLSGFWRDMAMVCAILLSYASMRRPYVRKVRWFLRQGRGWVSRRGDAGTDVRPRRVALAGRSARRPDGTDYERVLRPLIAPTTPIRRPAGSDRAPQLSDGDTQAARPRPAQPLLCLPDMTDEDDGENIFSNI